jgi:hypothetical protein
MMVRNVVVSYGLARYGSSGGIGWPGEVGRHRTVVAWVEAVRWRGNGQLRPVWRGQDWRQWMVSCGSMGLGRTGTAAVDSKGLVGMEVDRIGRYGMARGGARRLGR